VLYISLVQSLNGEESLFKNQIWIQMWILTRIKSSLPCHTPNVCTKFRLNLSTTLRYLAIYHFELLSLNGEESLKKFSSLDPDPDLHQNQISLSLSHTQPVHKISSGSIHNFLRYPVHTETDRQTERGENITSTFSGGGNKLSSLYIKQAEVPGNTREICPIFLTLVRLRH